jgi:hypothetical protein
VPRILHPFFKPIGARLKANNFFNVSDVYP